MRGCITKRRGKWYYVYDVGLHPDTGRRKQKWSRGFDTKQEAERALTKALNEFGQTGNIELTQETVKDYFSSWLAQKRQQVRPGTYNTYMWLVNTHIIPSLGKMKLKNITPPHLVQLYNQLLAKGLAPQTIKHISKILHDAFETALKWGQLNRNVAKLVKTPKVPRYEMKIWDETQVNTFLKSTENTRYFTLFLLAISTGMRKGEILALKWEDIDFANSRLTVRRSYVRGYKGFMFQEPKTTAGIRNILLPDQTVQSIKKHKINQNVERLKAGRHYQEFGLVFPTCTGKPMNPQQLDEAWNKAIKHSKLPKIRFHDLRHTHASLLLKSGVHAKVISERLGHSNTSITMNVYSHLLPGMQEQAANKINSMIQLG